MSRHGYSYDCDNIACWSGVIASATRGKRGQAYHDPATWAFTEATPEQRWESVRDWAAKQINVTADELLPMPAEELRRNEQ